MLISKYFFLILFEKANHREAGAQSHEPYAGGQTAEGFCRQFSLE
jgi:hypothetical protein